MRKLVSDIAHFLVFERLIIKLYFDFNLTKILFDLNKIEFQT